MTDTIGIRLGGIPISIAMKEQNRWHSILTAKGFRQKAHADVVKDYSQRLDEARRKHQRLVDALKHL